MPKNRALIYFNWLCSPFPDALQLGEQNTWHCCCSSNLFLFFCADIRIPHFSRFFTYFPFFVSPLPWFFFKAVYIIVLLFAWQSIFYLSRGSSLLCYTKEQANKTISLSICSVFRSVKPYRKKLSHAPMFSLFLNRQSLPIFRHTCKKLLCCSFCPSTPAGVFHAAYFIAQS